MSLNEYRAHTDKEAALKKKAMIYLNTQDVLFSSNKLLSLQLETIAKKWPNYQLGVRVASVSKLMKVGHDYLKFWGYQKRRSSTWEIFSMK